MKTEKQKAFMVAYELCHTEFLRYCSVVSYGRMDREDLVQDVVYSAYRNFHKIRNKEDLLHYLIRAARNRVITERRKRIRNVQWSESRAHQLLSKNVSAETLLDIQFLYDALRSLPEIQATSLVLFEVHGFKMREIASIMNSTEASVKMQVSRARKKLRSILSQDQTDRKKQRTIPPFLIGVDKSSKVGLEDTWCEVLKNVPPAYDVNNTIDTLAHLEKKTTTHYFLANNLPYYMSVAVSMITMLILLLPLFVNKTGITTPSVASQEGVDFPINSESQFQPGQKELMPIAVLGLDQQPLTAATGVISQKILSNSVPTSLPRSRKASYPQSQLYSSQKHYGEYTITGKWNVKEGDNTSCIHFHFVESGKDWKTKWKFNECFEDQNLEDFLDGKSTIAVLERSAGQLVLSTTKKSHRGTFRFRPNESFKSYLEDLGFDPHAQPTKIVSVTGSHKYTGDSTLVYSNAPVDVLWYKFFAADINSHYINYLRSHGYLRKDINQLWELADQEVSISFLEEIVPYRTLTVDSLRLADIAKLKMLEVNPSLLRTIAECNIENLTVEDIISIHQLQIPSSYINNLCESLIDTLTAEYINRSFLMTTSGDRSRTNTIFASKKKQSTNRANYRNQVVFENEERQVIPLSSFNKLILHGNIKVGIAKYDVNQAIVFGDETTASRVKVELKGNTLTISPKLGFRSKFKYDVIVSGENIIDMVVRNGAKPFSIDMPKNTVDTLSSFIERKMASQNIVGYQILVIEHGETTFQFNSGFLKDGNPNKVNENTVFMIASLTKPIYALAVMKLVDKGLVSLDDPINDYLPTPVHNPYFPEDTITFRMLLAHTSSIKDNWEILGNIYHPNSSISEELTITRFVKDYFYKSGKYFNPESNFHQEAPELIWDYSNASYILLGHLIEEITSKKMKDFCQQEIFTPLGMNNTFWYLHDISHDNISYPHRIENEKIIPLPHYGYPSFPEGQIRTSANDYAKFLSIFLNQGKVNGTEFISSDLMVEFFKIQYPSLNSYQAIAWNNNEFGSEDFYQQVPHLPAHTGLEAGITTATLFDPHKKAAVIIFNNTQPDNFKGLLEIMIELAKAVGMTK